MVQFIESELELLKKEVGEMWTLVYNQMEMAYQAVLSMNVEQARQVIMREKRVNAFELKIDSDVEDVISLYSPVGVELRFALAMLKINTNLERIGDFAESIARYVVVNEQARLDVALLEKSKLKEMFDVCLSMLKTTQQALLEENIELATSVIPKDNVLDEINADVTSLLAEYLVSHPDEMLPGLHLVSVFRKLERAGDHITNMAEEIVFFVDAKVLKHSGKTDEGYSKE